MKRRLLLVRTLLLLFPLAGNSAQGDKTMSLTLTSSRFTAHGEIPTIFTCEGKDLSPPLAFAGIPQGTRSLALIVDDPDAPDPKAPQMTWVHWLVFNLPPSTTGLPEGASKETLPVGTVVGLNDWKRAAYGGPCPPIGRHRYFFKLFALDTLLGLKSANKAQLEAAMAGHVLGKAELVGTYQKVR